MADINLKWISRVQRKEKNDEEVGISENLKDTGNQSSINYIQITDTLLKIK